MKPSNESHSQEWLPNSTQQAAMNFLASCLGFGLGIVGGSVALILFCLILGKTSEILLK